MSTEATRSLKPQRDAALDRLSRAFAEDHLDADQFEQRVTRVHQADSETALAALVQDLPAASADLPAVVEAGPPQDLGRAPDVRALFASIERAGPWTPPAELRVQATFGSVVLDLREARLRPGVTHIDVGVLFGSAELIVPPTLAVVMEGSALFGSFEHLAREAPDLSPTAPRLVVRGTCRFGSVEIRTDVPPSWRELKRAAGAVARRLLPKD